MGILFIGVVVVITGLLFVWSFYLKGDGGKWEKKEGFENDYWEKKDVKGNTKNCFREDDKISPLDKFPSREDWEEEEPMNQSVELKYVVIHVRNSDPTQAELFFKAYQGAIVTCGINCKGDDKGLKIYMTGNYWIINSSGNMSAHNTYDEHLSESGTVFRDTPVGAELIHVSINYEDRDKVAEAIKKVTGK